MIFCKNLLLCGVQVHYQVKPVIREFDIYNMSTRVDTKETKIKIITYIRF